MYNRPGKYQSPTIESVSTQANFREKKKMAQYAPVSPTVFLTGRSEQTVVLQEFAWKGSKWIEAMAWSLREPCFKGNVPRSNEYPLGILFLG